MFLRRLIATITVASTLATVAPALSHLLHSAPYTKPLLRSIADAGVTVYHVSDCKNPNLRGLYLTDQAKLYICVNSINTPLQYQQVLTHEAVHVIQDCLSGSGVGDGVVHTVTWSVKTRLGDTRAKQFADVISSNLSDHHSSLVKRFYPESHYPLEFEAFSLQDSPKSVIYLLSVCP